MHCNKKGGVNCAGTGPGFRIRYGGTLDTVKSQPGSRRLAPAHLIDVKTERQRVSRDLAVRRVVLPGWVKSVVRAIPNSTETPECLLDIHEGPPNSWPSRMPQTGLGCRCTVLPSVPNSAASTS
jgi:hypothetical protein